jgi:ligand-binding sensor protein
MATVARNTRKPVIEECDAGMLKIVAPIFVGDELVGTAGGCGKIFEGGEVETFMVNRASDIPEDKVEELARTVGTAKRRDMEELADFIARRISEIVGAYEKNKG